jgi:hypothetical protein
MLAVSVSEMEWIAEAMVSCHLAPENVGALLAGRHPIELTPTRLLRLSKNLPHDWSEQCRFLARTKVR